MTIDPDLLIRRSTEHPLTADHRQLDSGLLGRWSRDLGHTARKLPGSYIEATDGTLRCRIERHLPVVSHRHRRGNIARRLRCHRGKRVDWAGHRRSVGVRSVTVDGRQIDLADVGEIEDVPSGRDHVSRSRRRVLRRCRRCCRRQRRGCRLRDQVDGVCRIDRPELTVALGIDEALRSGLNHIAWTVDRAHRVDLTEVSIDARILPGVSCDPHRRLAARHLLGVVALGHHGKRGE